MVFSLLKKFPIERKSGVAVVCSNFGGIDDIRPIPTEPGISSYYFTDVADLMTASARTWTRVINPDFPRHDFGARLRGRYFKHQIHRLDAVQHHRWLVWIDANVRVNDVRFITRAIDKMKASPKRNRVFLIPHPFRDTVRQEYEHISDEIANGSEYLSIRYKNEKMLEQMSYFDAKGWNLDAPLWCGTVWIVENNPIIAQCWDDWWDQNLRFGMMDQLSLPVILEKHGIKPHAADFALDKNPYFEWGAHAKLA